MIPPRALPLTRLRFVRFKASLANKNASSHQHWDEAMLRDTTRLGTMCPPQLPLIAGNGSVLGAAADGARSVWPPCLRSLSAMSRALLRQVVLLSPSSPDIADIISNSCVSVKRFRLFVYPPHFGSSGAAQGRKEVPAQKYKHISS